MKNSKRKIAFPRVDVVEASAGSGKTYALAKRYIQLIMDPQLEPGKELLKSILAITFTNKATIEMKERILEFLKKIALDAFKDKQEKKDILSALPISENDARKIAHGFMDNIIRNYNLFQVQTIDSFVNTLLSGFTFHLGFSSALRIKENYRVYLKYSLDGLIDRMNEDKNIRKALDSFLDYYLFVENRPGWFSKREMLGLVEALYNHSNTYGGMFIKPDVDADALREKKQKIIAITRYLADNAPEGTDKRFAKSLGNFVAKNPDNFDAAKLPAYFAREEFSVKKGAEVPENVARMWNDMRNNLQEFCEWESRAAFKPYIEIFALVLDEFRKLAVNDDIIFLQELNTHAQSVAGDETIPIEEVYCRLGTRLRHFLIDEFQDTSRLQWKNIVPLVHEALSYGGSLFYVGDKKQAIFRFRGGDVSLFDSVQEGIKTCKPEQTFLDMNYRSQKEIVQFNNELFSPDNLKRFVKAIESPQKKHLQFSDEDIDRVLKIFAGSEQNWKEKNTLGYVRLERVEAANIDERNVIMREKLISLIKDLRSRFSLGDIAILARENRNVELCTSWLIEEGMPVESRKTLSIREHHLIKELISFLKFLNSPIDNIPFASFISGSIFGKAEEISPAAVQDFLFELGKARKQGRVIYLYREFRKKFPAVWGGLIEEFFRSVGFMPVYELVISILSKFKAVENFPEHQGFFMKFLELVKEKEENYTGIASFLDYFEDIEEKELYVNVTHEDSVKITTIHDAKGLEFPVVIVPFLEMDITVGAGGSGARKSHVVKQEAKGLSLIQLKKEYGFYSEKLKQVYREEYIKSLIDELDALYVALTRARYEMYLFVPSKAGHSSNIANIFFPPEILERGTREKYKKEEDAQKRPSVKLPASQYSDWIKILKDEFMEPSQLMNRDRIMHGEVLHCILSCVGNLHPDGKDAYLGAAREKAKLTFPYVTDLDKYMSVVEKLLQDKKFKPFFYIKEGSLYQEKEVVDPSGNTKRIDRLIVTPREVWVIDYKSSKDESGSHREQIREYMNIVKSLYPGLKPKGFLIYLDTISVEEVHE